MNKIKFEDYQVLLKLVDGVFDYAEKHRDEWEVECDDNEWQRRFEEYMSEQSEKRVIEYGYA